MQFSELRLEFIKAHMALGNAVDNYLSNESLPSDKEQFCERVARWVKRIELLIDLSHLCESAPGSWKTIERLLARTLSGWRRDLQERDVVSACVVLAVRLEATIAAFAGLPKRDTDTQLPTELSDQLSLWQTNLARLVEGLDSVDTEVEELFGCFEADDVVKPFEHDEGNLKEIAKRLAANEQLPTIASALGLTRTAIAESQPGADKICALRGSGLTQQEVATKFGVSRKVIANGEAANGGEFNLRGINLKNSRT